jgi:hypothetical protein
MQDVQIPVPPAPPGAPLATTNLEKAIDLVQAQINGLKREISELTGQLVPGTTDAREEAINEQINNANERLESLQRQHDRMITGETGEAIEHVPPPDFGNPNDIPEGVQRVIEQGLIFGAMVILGYPLIRLIARRFEPRPRTDPSTDVSPRLDRLEQGMDAVAIEIERVSEGQRFTNKLLGEMRALPAPNPMDQWAGARPKVEEKIERR